MVPNTILAKAKVVYDQQNADQKKLEEMKTKDTDRDGLNDYVEQYTYGTSPYLADSDSDGIGDSVEIASGSNPNCAKNQNCSLITGSVAVDAAGRTGTSTDSFQDLLDIASQNAGTSGVGTSSAPSTNLPSISQLQNMSNGQVKGTLLPPGQMTPAALRKYMLENNLATQPQLDQLSDTQLLQLYQDAYNQVQQKYNDDGPTPESVTPNQP